MNNQQEKTLLPSHTKRELKKLAHHLKPIVQIGKKGLSDALIQEIDAALLAHELIKVQIAKDQKDSLPADLERIIRETHSEHIDTIGNIVILFRKRDQDSHYDI